MHTCRVMHINSLCWKELIKIKYFLLFVFYQISCESILEKNMTGPIFKFSITNICLQFIWTSKKKHFQLVTFPFNGFQLNHKICWFVDEPFLLNSITSSATFYLLEIQLAITQPITLRILIKWKIETLYIPCRLHSHTYLIKRNKKRTHLAFETNKKKSS